MSYIVEALRRAEQERHLGEVPDVNSVATPLANEQRSRWPWLVAGALLAQVLLLGAWWVGRQPAPVLTPEPLAAALEQPSAGWPNSASGVVIQPPTPLPGPRLVREMTAAQEPPVMVRPDPAPAAARWAEPAAPTTVDPVPAGLTLQPPPAQPTDSLGPAPGTGSVETDLGTISMRSSPETYGSLPAGYRRSLPNLHLDVHVFSTPVGESFVVINGRRYMAGDRLREGPQLEEITREGVVLRHNGRSFLLPLKG